MLPLPKFVNKNSNSVEQNTPNCSSDRPSNSSPSVSGQSSWLANRPVNHFDHQRQGPNAGYASNHRHHAGHVQNSPYPQRQPQKRASCNACNLTFFDEDKLIVHLSEHITCGHEGCTFQANHKVVQNHRKTEHKTERINFETLSNKVIKLDTPEDIAKWREARRKNYPGSNKTNTSGSETQPEREQRDQNNSSNWRGRGRGRGRGGGRGRGRQNYSNPTPNDNKSVSKTPELVTKNEVEEGELSDSDIEDIDRAKTSDTIKEQLVISEIKKDGEVKSSESVKKVQPSLVGDYPASEDDLILPPSTSTAPELDASKLEAVKSANGNNKRQVEKKWPQKQRSNVQKGPYQRPPQKRNPTLYEKLMLNDVQREESKLLDCIKLIVDKKFKL